MDYVIFESSLKKTGTVKLRKGSLPALVHTSPHKEGHSPRSPRLGVTSSEPEPETRKTEGRYIFHATDLFLPPHAAASLDIVHFLWRPFCGSTGSVPCVVFTKLMFYE